MASIVKREGPRGTAYHVRYRDPAGKARGRTFARKRDADKFANGVATDMARGTWIDPDAGRLTLESYATSWLHNRAGLRPRTLELYRSLLDHHILPTLGKVDLAKLSSSAVRSWYADMSRAERPSPTTVAKCYRLLRAMLTTAVEDDLIARNPCVIKGAGVERSAERPVATPAQVWAIADAIDPRYRALVLTAAFTGCRWGELIGLAGRNIDLLHRTVTIDHQLIQLNDGTVKAGPPKSDAGYRTISIPTELVPILEAHLVAYAEPGPDGLIFVGAKGAPLNRGRFHLKWSAALEGAGLSGFTFHDLRHTSNTLAAATGASTRELMHRMGHSSPAAALRYQHATAERDRVLADALGAALGRPFRESAS
jgi:integrase